MRKLKSDEIASLKKVTHLKKTMLCAELEILRKRIREKEAEIAWLDKEYGTHLSTDEMQSFARWLEWKKKEQQRLNTEHALLRLEHDQFALKVGRAVAEDAVVDQLISKSQEEEQLKERERREQNALHFLSNDVGDKDV